MKRALALVGALMMWSTVARSAPIQVWFAALPGAPIAQPTISGVPASSVVDDDGDDGYDDDNLPPVSSTPNPSVEHVGSDPAEDGSDSPALAFPAVDVPSDDVQLKNDPQLAVSPNYIVAIEAHNAAFLDKSTRKLLAKKPKGIGPTISSFHVFNAFMAKTIVDAAGKTIPNPNQIDQLTAKITGLKAGECDLSDPKHQTGCFSEVYDLRVIYDHEHDRFIFAGSVRGAIRGGSPWNHRFLVIAMSVTEDPRDGFYEYLVADGGDFPLATVDNAVLSVTVDHTTGSSVVLLATKDLSEGAPNPRAQDYAAPVFDNQRAIAVVSHAPNDYTLVAEWPGAEQGAITLYAFGHALDGKAPIKGTIAMSNKIPLGDAYPNPPGTPVFRDGKLYFTTVEALSGSSTTGKCLRDEREWLHTLEPGAGSPTTKQSDLDHMKKWGPCRIRLVELGLTIGTSITGKVLVDTNFGGRAANEASDTVISYSLPALEITKAGDVVITFARTQYNTLSPSSKEIYPEARYIVLYHDEKKLRVSAVLEKGTCCNSHPNPNAKVGSPVKLTQESVTTLDISQAVLDPVDEQTVWMANAAGVSACTAESYYQLVLGAVRP